MSSTPWEDELSQKTLEGQKRLALLQQQQEQLEQEQRLLEELKQKQSEVKRGRREMVDKLKRALAAIEREEEIVQREAIQTKEAHEAFAASLDAVQEIEPDHFDPDNLQVELANALESIEMSRDTFSQYQNKVKCLRGEGETLSSSSAEGAGAEDHDPDAFGVWFRRGFAFSLPLIFLGLIWMMAFIVKK